MDNKTFKFYKAISPFDTVEYERTEDQLTDNEITLLAGQIIKDFLDLPQKAKEIAFREITLNHFQNGETYLNYGRTS